AAAVSVGPEKRPEVDRLVLPDYDGPCVTNVVPSLRTTRVDAPDWLPVPAVGARQVVLFVVDGLGWEQLQARLSLTPTLAAMVGGQITTDVPSTTATALTSLTTGLTTVEHGVVGFRMTGDCEVLNG